MNCKQCNTPISPTKKLGTLYCDHNCQQANYKRRNKIKLQIKQLEKNIEFNNKWIDEENLKLSSLSDKKTIDINQEKTKIEKDRAECSKIRTLLSDKEGLFKKELIKLLDQYMGKYGDDYSYIKFGTPQEQQEVLEKHFKRFSQILEAQKRIITRKEKKVEEQQFNNLQLITDRLEIQYRITKANNELESYSKELTELKAIDLESLPPKFNPKKGNKITINQKMPAKGLTADQVSKMRFDSLILNGELGLFLGELQRKKCAIALTGDSGAGKSTFSFQLAKAFLDKDKSVGYFSLESGITETTKKLIDSFGINSSKFEIYGDGTLDDIRKLSLKYDCIIVDSYSKISSKAEDFENLRQEFPNTFFIIIFQKTTDGKIRGGSSIIYNSTATIDIRITQEEHRIAVMQKSRYKSENFVYSINNDEVLKSTNAPIKWSEIEKEWTSPFHH